MFINFNLMNHWEIMRYLSYPEKSCLCFDQESLINSLITSVDLILRRIRNLSTKLWRLLKNLPTARCFFIIFIFSRIICSNIFLHNLLITSIFILLYYLLFTIILLLIIIISSIFSRTKIVNDSRLENKSISIFIGVSNVFSVSFQNGSIRKNLLMISRIIDVIFSISLHILVCIPIIDIINLYLKSSNQLQDCTESTTLLLPTPQSSPKVDIESISSPTMQTSSLLPYRNDFRIFLPSSSSQHTERIKSSFSPERKSLCIPLPSPSQNTERIKSSGAPSERNKLRIFFTSAGDSERTLSSEKVSVSEDIWEA